METEIEIKTERKSLFKREAETETEREREGQIDR